MIRRTLVSLSAAVLFCGAAAILGSPGRLAMAGGDDPSHGSGAAHGGKADGAAGGEKDWSHHSGNLTFVVGYEKGMAAAKDTGKPPMLFITTTWCGYCKKLAGESFVDAEVLKVLEKFTPVIVDGDVEKETCNKYGANGFPHVVFADLKGEKAFEVRGYVPKDRFLATATDAAKKLKQGKPSKEYAALLEGKEALDAAVAKGDAKAAFAAIAKIEKTGRDGPIADAAKAQKAKLVEAGQQRLASIRESAAADPAKAATAARLLAKEYAGTDIGKDAEKLAKELAPAPADGAK